MTITCPHCDGRGQTFAFINTGLDSSMHRSGYVQCFTCCGLGSISAEHARRIEEGKAIRAARQASGELLSEAAERLGMSPAQLSAIEFGRATSSQVLA